MASNVDMELLKYYTSSSKWNPKELLDAGANPFFYLYGQRVPFWHAVHKDKWDDIQHMFTKWATSDSPSWRMRDFMYGLLIDEKWIALLKLSQMLEATAHLHKVIASISREFSLDNIMDCQMKQHRKKQEIIVSCNTDHNML